ncbi:MAG: family 43 glycosylhydrolase [Clostridiales bacterium]|nr:family 43 glycosylhydrolase [Clostridiales bacterium]
MISFTSATKEIAEEAFQAALEGDLPRIKVLADYSFHMETCDQEGNSLLHYAVHSGNTELVRFLVERCGLDPAWANRELITPFDLAHSMGEKGRRLEEYFEQVCGFSHDTCYRNPILRGMYPDPSIVRVGEDYYMVNSSFIYFPGIPVSHSRDLVHWKVIGYVMTDPDWAREHLGPLSGGRGFWAPDISYHDGWFTVCATLRLNDDAPCIQLQMVTRSRKPEGPYEEPVLHPVRGIDPSIFHDDDGKTYMLLNRGARLMEISADGKTCLSEPELIWYGWDKHGPEGPHLLKKDGWYYCFLAEGGTGIGHKITVARSRNLRGPYEDCPYNPIMTQKDSAGAIQCCGHGKPVSTPDGRWYMVYLASRLYDGAWGFLGRETCLDEITWTADGWPLVNRRRGPSYMAPLPFPEKMAAGEQEESLPYGGWLCPRTIEPSLIRTEADGRLLIRGQGLDLKNPDCRSLLLKRQPAFSFTDSFEMEALEGDGFEDAGMTLYYDENTYIKFGISGERAYVMEYIDDQYTRVTEGPAGTAGGSVGLRVETRGLVREFYLNDTLFAALDQVTCLCSEGLKKGKRFTGAMTGVYNNGKNLICWRQHSRI